jgi:hypothetical protein
MIVDHIHHVVAFSFTSSSGFNSVENAANANASVTSSAMSYDADLHYPPYVRYLLMLILEHIFVGLQIFVYCMLSNTPEAIQKKIASEEVN